MKDFHYKLVDIDEKGFGLLMQETCPLKGFKALVEACSDENMGIVIISMLTGAYEDLHRQCKKIYEKYPYVQSLPEHVYNVNKLFACATNILSVAMAMNLSMKCFDEDQIFEKISRGYCLADEYQCDHITCQSRDIMNDVINFVKHPRMVLEVLYNTFTILQKEEDRFQRAPRWLHRAMKYILAVGWGMKLHLGVSTWKEVESIQHGHRCDKDCLRTKEGIA